MEIIEKKDNQIVFKAEIEDSLANAIRRHISEIPILAVDTLEIHKNDSSLYDETVAHRVGLTPLKMEKTFTDKTEVKLKLSTEKEGMVYSGELKGGADVVFGKIPITALNKGQELEFVATAKMGKGSEHSKFIPGLMFYRNTAEIILDKEFLPEIKKILPEIEIKEKGDKIILNDLGKTEIVDVIEGLVYERSKEAEVKRKDELIITVESFGQLEVKDVFKKSIDALEKDLKEISKVVDKI